ncbi:uncharacterized protein LOC116767710 [Danaus plexippus]|uniref:uncharacterized protein LOC116767710 n=1 Tax=Danaus plexippus TaxID=13037 RepID=UPI002AB1ECF6|nr:uncharacterized protein LOC116767710 [Danaus plexippus]
MKLLYFVLFIIANLRINPQASLDSFLPTNNQVLLADTTKSSDKSCSRPCKFNVKPRRCEYDFVIRPILDEEGRPSLTINDQSPGPAVHVCLNDIVVVKVKNEIPNQDVTLHWHGIEQKGTPYMDGVPMITQCPISYGSIYQYSFIASSPGTFFYHADSVVHQSDGIYGSLIVDQPQPLEPNGVLYDYDRSKEHTFLIAARFPELLTSRLEGKSEIGPESLIINGDNFTPKIYVMTGYSYRLRFINAIALECPIVVNVQRHAVVVIATDSNPVKPVTNGAFRLYPGERIDVVLRADQPSGGYWLQISGEGACETLKTHIMLIYSGFNYTSMLEQGPNTESEIGTFIDSEKYLSLKDSQAPAKVKSIYLRIDRNSFDVKDSDLDFRYRSDAMKKKPFYPATLSLHAGVVQINGKNFLYPNAVYLLKPREVRPDITCYVEEEQKHKEPQCLQVLKAQINEPIELILANEGFGSNDSYTFHMHGYNMQIISTWRNPSKRPFTKEEFMKLDENHSIVRNEVNPPLKNTIHVPNKGLTVVRFTPTSGGSWLLECRSCSLSTPVALLVSVPLSIPKSVIESLPGCGSYRPADVLLN